MTICGLPGWLAGPSSRSPDSTPRRLPQLLEPSTPAAGLPWNRSRHYGGRAHPQAMQVLVAALHYGLSVGLGMPAGERGK